MIGGEPKGRPLGLHTSGQTSKVKGFQNTYMTTVFGTFGTKSLTSRQEFGSFKNRNQTLVKRPNFFSIKYSKSDKKTLIIYFNGLLSSPGEEFGVWPLDLTGHM